MPQATEQKKNLGSGEQNSQTSKQCLKQCKTVTKQHPYTKAWNEHKNLKKTKFKMKENANTYTDVQRALIECAHRISQCIS